MPWSGIVYRSASVAPNVLNGEKGKGTFRFKELVLDLEFGFRANLALVRQAFTGLPLVQMEFQTRVPWVLDEPEPEA